MILHQVGQLGGIIGDLHLIQTDDLWNVTAPIVEIKRLIDQALEDIHRLEAQTGRPWYQRR